MIGGCLGESIGDEPRARIEQEAFEATRGLDPPIHRCVLVRVGVQKQSGIFDTRPMRMGG